MAEVVKYTDDLTGEPDAKRVEFIHAGQSYVVDLVEAGEKDLREALAWIEKVLTKARKVRKPADTAFSKLSAEDKTAIRADLQRPTGRVGDDEVEAWQTAKKSKAASK